MGKTPPEHCSECPRPDLDETARLKNAIEEWRKKYAAREDWLFTYKQRAEALEGRVAKLEAELAAVEHDMVMAIRRLLCRQ